MNKDFSLLASGREDYNDFMQWLMDHNWCKVTPCYHCMQYWAPPGSRRGSCLKHHITVNYDDFCSDAEERINDNEL